MKNINLFSMMNLLLILVGFNAFAQQQGGDIRIPLSGFNKPAADLMGDIDKSAKPYTDFQSANGSLVLKEKKQILTYGKLAERYKKYKTLADLNPEDNKYWQNTFKLTAVDQKLYAEMPSENETVLFDEYLGSVRELGIYSIFVKPMNNPTKRWGITFGMQVHASLMKAALLRKVGFYQESPKYIKNLKLKFSSLNDLNDFYDKAFCKQGPNEKAIDCLSLDEEKDGYLSDKNEKDYTVILHGAYIEKLNAEVPSLFDGLTPANEDNLQYLAQSRAFRALAVPFVLGDVKENINTYSAQSVDVKLGWAKMKFANYTYFDMITTHDDVQWALLRYSKLKQNDWDEIVDAGQFPACTIPLVKAKLLYRYRDMVQTFFSKDDAANMLAGIQIQKLKTINTDCVKDGKLTSEKIAGYPQRFSHGPRKSIIQDGDYFRFGSLATESAAIQTAINQLNAKLQLSNSEVNGINGVEFGPGGIRLLRNATDMFVNIGFNANRAIATGTYFGSDAKLQLVDTVMIAGGLGWQNINEGLNGVNRNFGANVSRVRSYTHVTPIVGITQATKIPWKDLLVKSKLDKLAAPLNDGKLTPFLANLQIGEVFTITDAIAAGGSLGWQSGLDMLFGFVNGLSASVAIDVSKQVVLRQIQFSRTKEGLQVYVRDVDSHMLDANGNKKPNHSQKSSIYGVQFDANYFINIFKLRAQLSKSDLHTDAFLIKYNSELMGQIEDEKLKPTDPELLKEYEKQKEYAKNVASALRSLIFDSDVTGLYKNFKAQQFEIDHNVKTTDISAKFLWFRSTALDQTQLTTVYKTELPKSEDGTTLVNKPIEILVDRKGELRGRDLFGFSLEGLNYFLTKKYKDKALNYTVPGENPSQMPFGFAQWRVVRTDSEVTPGGRTGMLPTVSLIDHIWGGWSMKRKQMDKILNEVKESMKEINFANYELIPEGALDNVEKVDFFKVTSHLALLPAALDQIKDLVLAPEAANGKVEQKKFVAKFFQKLSELNGKARPEDKAVYNNLIKLMGNGNEVEGQKKYNLLCDLNKRKVEGATGYNYTYMNGTGYDCLEPWIEKIIKLSRDFPKDDKSKQNRWMTEVLYVLDEQIPQAYVLNYLTPEKFIYYVELHGFRVGDEEGDDGYYISRSYGAPKEPAPYANGLLQILSEKSYISPVEIGIKDGRGM